jgi:hypothetical protein
MTRKTLLTSGLLLFVAVSLALAVADVVGWRSNPALQVPTAGVSTTSDQPDAEWTAYFFHATHRCPTCRKIEEYAHEALLPEIEQGRLVWQVADYTTPENRTLVKQFEVMTSSVVLVHRQADQIDRWKNLEEVWDHTHDRSQFHTFIHQAWDGFQKE